MITYTCNKRDIAAIPSHAGDDAEYNKENSNHQSDYLNRQRCYNQHKTKNPKVIWEEAASLIRYSAPPHFPKKVPLPVEKSVHHLVCPQSLDAPDIQTDWQ